MPQFRARSAGLQPGISPNADLKVGATSAVAPETGALRDMLSSPKGARGVLMTFCCGRTAALRYPLPA
jgi:hypothetical protein